MFVKEKKNEQENPAVAGTSQCSEGEFVFSQPEVRILKGILIKKELFDMNKKTVALTAEQYREIIHTMKQGFIGCRPNVRIATALTLEANLGLRISDIVKLRLMDIVRDGDRYRLSIKEQKTQKARTFTVPLALYQFIRCYCMDYDISPEAPIFPITERAAQKQLKLVCDYLGYTGISTHSFRKFYATEIYKNSHYNIALVQQLLQHSSAAVTQRYIGIQQQEIEKAIEGHLCLEV